MPDSNHPSGIRVPYGPEANVVPQDLARVREDLTNLISYPVANATERNTKLGTLPAGTRAHSTDGRYMWIKTGAGSTAWDTVYYKSASSGGGSNGWNVVPMLNGFTAPRPVQWKRIGIQVFWRGAIQLPDPYAGNDWVAFCDVPAEAQPIASSADQVYPSSANTGANSVLNYLSGQMRLLVRDGRPNAFFPVSMTYLTE